MPAWMVRIYADMLSRLSAEEDIRLVTAVHAAEPRKYVQRLNARAAGVSREEEARAKMLAQRFSRALRVYAARSRQRKDG